MPCDARGYLSGDECLYSVKKCNSVIAVDLHQSVDTALIRGNVVSVRSNSMTTVSRQIPSNTLLRMICEAYEGDPEGLGSDIMIYAEQGSSLKEIVEDLINSSDDLTT